MSTAGLEKAVAIRLKADGLALEAVFTAGADGDVGVVIAPPHPLYGGSMDSPVVGELTQAFGTAGIGSLRFNWRGVGDSAGETSGESADADSDYAAALAHVEESVSGRVVAAGYSFGAAAALRASSGHSRVDRIVLVSPPPSLIDAEVLADFSGTLLIVAGDRDRFAPEAQLRAIAEAAGRVQLVMVPGADHFYASGLAEIGRAVSGWLET